MNKGNKIFLCFNFLTQLIFLKKGNKNLEIKRNKEDIELFYHNIIIELIYLSLNINLDMEFFKKYFLDICVLKLF